MPLIESPRPQSVTFGFSGGSLTAYRTKDSSIRLQITASPITLDETFPPPAAYIREDDLRRFLDRIGASEQPIEPILETIDVILFPN